MFFLLKLAGSGGAKNIVSEIIIIKPKSKLKDNANKKHKWFQLYNRLKLFLISNLGFYDKKK